MGIDPRLILKLSTLGTGCDDVNVAAANMTRTSKYFVYKFRAGALRSTEVVLEWDNGWSQLLQYHSRISYLYFVGCTSLKVTLGIAPTALDLKCHEAITMIIMHKPVDGTCTTEGQKAHPPLGRWLHFLRKNFFSFVHLGMRLGMRQLNASMSPLPGRPRSSLTY